MQQGLCGGGKDSKLLVLPMSNLDPVPGWPCTEGVRWEEFQPRPAPPPLSRPPSEAAQHNSRSSLRIPLGLWEGTSERTNEAWPTPSLRLYLELKGWSGNPNLDPSRDLTEYSIRKLVARGTGEVGSTILSAGGKRRFDPETLGVGGRRRELQLGEHCQDLLLLWAPSGPALRALCLWK